MSLVPTPLLSQANVGRIFGSINDPSGALIPGATVTITDVDRGVARTLITDEAGAYNAPSLPPGAYRVRAELTGFKTVERPNVVLEIAKELKIDLTLEPGAVSEKGTVTDKVRHQCLARDRQFLRTHRQNRRAESVPRRRSEAGDRP